MGTDALIVTSPTGVDVELAIAGPGSRAYALHHRLAYPAAAGAQPGSPAATYLVTKVAYITGNLRATMTVDHRGLPAIPGDLLSVPSAAGTDDAGTHPGQAHGGRAHRQPARRHALDPRLLIRNAFRLIDCLPVLYGVGLCTTIFTAQRVRFGDLAAGTLLVHDGETEAKALTQLGCLVPQSCPGCRYCWRWVMICCCAGRTWSRTLDGGWPVICWRASLQRLGSTQTPCTRIRRDDRILQQRLRSALSGKAT